MLYIRQCRYDVGFSNIDWSESERLCIFKLAPKSPITLRFPWNLFQRLNERWADQISQLVSKRRVEFLRILDTNIMITLFVTLYITFGCACWVGFVPSPVICVYLNPTNWKLSHQHTLQALIRVLIPFITPVLLCMILRYLEHVEVWVREKSKLLSYEVGDA